MRSRIGAVLAACRAIFNTPTAITSTIFDTSRQNIKVFMESIRRKVVTRKRGNVTPKLHLLEDHVADQMERFGVGLAIHGEQGGETIHHEWNELRRRLDSVPNDLERLRLVAKAHALSTLPSNIAKTPEVQRRAKRKKD